MMPRQTPTLTLFRLRGRGSDTMAPGISLPRKRGRVGVGVLPCP